MSFARNNDETALSTLKIGIFNEPDGEALGGSECLAALVAEVLSQEHEVELIHRKPGLTQARLAAATGTDLRNVRLREANPPRPLMGDYRKPLQSFQRAKKLGSGLSCGYDVFISFVHEDPHFCHAKVGILIVLFPFSIPTYQRCVVSPSWTWSWCKEHLARLYFRWEWKLRLASYKEIVSISAFTKQWVERRWSSQSRVIHPAVRINEATCVEKQNQILSLGRFSLGGHPKNQKAMLRTAASLDLDTQNWRYICAGALGTSPDEARFFRELSTLTTESVTLKTNLTRQEVQLLLGQSKIFWHAAGWGVDERERPELTEHFGIAVVEAMAAGSVPVVPARGGLKELVEHERSGYLWETLDDLTTYTARLMDDPELLGRMAQAAKERSRRFSKEACIDSLLALVRAHCVPGGFK